MTATIRGPLPPRVYWTRRVMVLGTALLLVFGIARVLVGGSDASSDRGTETAYQAAADSTPSTSALPTEQAVGKGKKHKPGKKKTKTEPVLAAPDGPCEDTDIAVTPVVDKAVAGSAVLFVLELRTISSAACTWRVSPDSLTVKLTSGSDDIWSSRECPRSVPTQNVVVRNAVSTKVGIRWTGRRADRDCTRTTPWAMPGWYHIAASALAGEPSDVQFELVRPSATVVTRSPEPQQDDGGKNRDKPRHRDKPHQGEVKQR